MVCKWCELVFLVADSNNYTEGGKAEGLRWGKGSTCDYQISNTIKNASLKC